MQLRSDHNHDLVAIGCDLSLGSSSHPGSSLSSDRWPDAAGGGWMAEWSSYGAPSGGRPLTAHPNPNYNLGGKIKERVIKVMNLKKVGMTKRSKAKDMGAEVVDNNPYSRLMALQRMDLINLIQGIGGVGSVAIEMLTRCGIGHLLLYDYDIVELANMNRLFFCPDQVGMTKTDAAVQTLEEINPDVLLDRYSLSITTVKGFEVFVESLKREVSLKSREMSGVDVVLSCVDNYEARMVVNQRIFYRQSCNELGET
ncbi:ubiquitin-like modifier-activating enzyme 5 [Zingiber officinale]|uniref:ubiquitin-like modifier-activating enzyme 5 n=1 Tax=Zingiber officinale TaxID=94328 RepID=UPI001C4B8C13|nr:ubiquitin-like modifier-activating enzyme 5 [Zingiber officinale]